MKARVLHLGDDFAQSLIKRCSGGVLQEAASSQIYPRGLGCYFKKNLIQFDVPILFTPQLSLEDSDGIQHSHKSGLLARVVDQILTKEAEKLFFKRRVEVLKQYLSGFFL